MRAVVFAFTGQGKRTARRIRDALKLAGNEARVAVPPRLADAEFAPYPGSLVAFVGSVFDWDALVFVGACGIAVRAIATFVASKRSDPAVLCVDERGGFVISLLSGHIGGANRLANRLAAALGATPVVTTATDVNGKFSVDAWAAERGLFITDMALAKRVSAEILNREIPIFVDGPRPDGPLPDGLVWDDSGALGICVSPRNLRPFDDTLLLVPQVLRLGIGCRRGAPASAIEALVKRVLLENDLRPEAVVEAASIDVKVDEEGLNAFCRAHRWPVAFYPAAALNAVPGDFEGSEFVKRTVGVDNVCERAAAASGGKIIVPKTAEDGVTVAVAELNWGVDFG